MASRRKFLKTSAAGALTMSALGGGAALGNTEPQNLIFLYIDDLNDFVGFLDGYKDVHTPNMNALAEQGTAYLNAHATVPICNPSRVSTLWGVDPGKSDIYSNDAFYWDSPYLSDKASLFKHLGENGYQVFGGGKVFHSVWEAQNDVDWDDYYVSPQRLHANLAKTPDGNALNVSGVAKALNTIFPADFGPYGSNDDYADYDVATWAADKIENAPDGFAIAVGLEKPHSPWVVPQKYFDLYHRNQLLDPSWRAGTDQDDLPESAKHVLQNNRLISGVVPFLQSEKKMRDHIHGYLASISFVDDMIGKVVKAWETRKENTTIVLVSDHGQFLGEKLQVGKLFLWDRATRVPLVMAGPNILANRHSTPMSLMNIYPTVCDLMDVPKPSYLDGEAVNLSLKDHISWLPNAISYYQYPDDPHKGYIVKSLRHDRFRITRWPDGYEFYDYVNDPKEYTNLWPKCQSWPVFKHFQGLLPV